MYNVQLAASGHLTAADDVRLGCNSLAPLDCMTDAEIESVCRSC